MKRIIFISDEDMQELQEGKIIEIPDTNIALQKDFEDEDINRKNLDKYLEDRKMMILK